MGAKAGTGVMRVGRVRVSFVMIAVFLLCIGFLTALGVFCGWHQHQLDYNAPLHY